MLEWNQIIQEIENDLELDVEQLARRALTTEYHLRRMFSMLAGVTLTTYMRNRRLTLAAFDLRAGHSVLDVAIKYGYGSSEAFSRGFRQFHGVNPSAARTGSATLSSQPQLRFNISVKGVKKLRFRVVEKDSFYLSGFRTHVNLIFEGDNQQIIDFEQSLDPQRKAALLDHNDVEPQGALSISTEIENQHEEGSTLEYWHAVATSEPVAGYDVTEVPSGMWVVFETEGKFPEDIQQMWADAATEWFPANPYLWAPGPQLLQTAIAPDGSNAQAQLWIPVTPVEPT